MGYRQDSLESSPYFRFLPLFIEFKAIQSALRPVGSATILAAERPKW